MWYVKYVTSLYIKEVGFLNVICGDFWVGLYCLLYLAAFSFMSFGVYSRLRRDPSLQGEKKIIYAFF